jgi:hypothetical protein
MKAVAMYEKPRLQKYGSFRELTQVGRSTGWDLVGILLDNDDVGCKTSGGIITGCVQYDRS